MLSEKVDVLNLKQQAPGARARVFQELNSTNTFTQTLGSFRTSNQYHSTQVVVDKEADIFDPDKGVTAKSTSSCRSGTAEELSNP